ncbi:MAG: hypothetical protein IJD92_03810 [Bacilli bacterium]|nr:hypothetical protein [Bacilli bacterium]
MNGFGPMLKDYLEYNKISQSDFADRLEISLKHMNEILNDNTNISEELMLSISLITDIDVNLIFYVENKKRMYNYLIKRYGTEKNIEDLLNSYYIKEMYKLNWIKLKDKESFVQNALDLLEYLKISNFDNINNYIDKRILYKKSDNANLTKIFLWIKRCDELIKKQNVTEYKKDKLNELLKELIEERNNKFNKEKLIKLFNEHGIYLVIEDALKGTKIRGCTMVKGNNPAIYLTTYLKEKSSFYFTLYHELSHVKSDYNSLKSKIIINDGDLETKSDNFALEQMISEKIYKEILMNRNHEKEICKNNKIPLSFLYTRLAYEGIIKYNSKEYLANRELLNE